MLINIPETVYRALEALAAETQQPLEQVLTERLQAALHDPWTALPPSERDEFAALHRLSDDALWTMAAAQLPKDVQTKTNTLMRAYEAGTLDTTDAARLAALVERGEKLMVRKAEAAAVLRERGHTISLANLST